MKLSFVFDNQGRTEFHISNDTKFDEFGLYV